MPRLMINYMRPLAALLFLLVSVTIVASYSLIPKVLAVGLSDFYLKYWQLLTWLFTIATLFLFFAFYAERSVNKRYWFYHLIALLLLVYFIYEVIKLFQIGDIFLGFLI